MLREDKRANIEKQLQSKTPIYASKPPPKSTREQIGRLLGSKQFVAGWKETYVYELSSGKPTAPTARARPYMQVVLSVERFDVLSAAQQLAPVLVTTWEGKQWWWYLDRFWWDTEGLAADDVQALILQREQKKQATLERARTQALGSLAVQGSEAPTQRVRDRAERERKQRLLEERADEVDERNASLEAKISALENLLAEGLEHERPLDEDVDRTPETIASYFAAVLEQSPYPDGFPKRHRVAFVPESRQLVVEFELPTVSIIPSVRAYRHVRARNAIEETVRPATQVRSLYALVVAQSALRTLYELFHADRRNWLETIVLNCYVDTIDPATGQPARPHLVTVRTSKELFQSLNLRQVEPLACLRGLRAEVSRSPHELLPVRPIVQFDMVDPRFVEDSDVLSALDTRPNLMELTPKEFEALISNLFEKMGLDTRQTQASRDGGVDCVAWDHRPIFGGKVIIQAKRYKNTVGVSAVRDLFGTMQNEGASKGILVTTSGYGRSSYEFADGKPLELLTGSNLLHLLSEHTGIEARIEAPEGWVDPTPDVGSDEPQVEPPATTA